MRTMIITAAALMSGLVSMPQMTIAMEYAYDYSIVSADFNGIGIVTSQDSFGDLSLDSVSGDINGIATVGLSDFGYADNIYYRDGSVDYGGVSIATIDGDIYNIFFGGIGHQNGPETDMDFTFLVSPHVSAVPEPATWAMMLIGLGVIGLTHRRSQGGNLARKG